MIKEVAKLYELAQDNNMVPILPAGQILEFDEEGKVKYRCYLKIVNKEVEHNQIISIPEGEYGCVQVELREETDVLKIIQDYWDEKEYKTVFIDNMMVEEYSLESRKGEIQILC